MPPMDASPIPAAPRPRRRRRILLVLVALLVAAGILVWLLFQRVPDWYQPVVVTAADKTQVLANLTHTTEDFTQQLRNVGVPFEYRLTQDQINAWWAIREEVWPLAREWIPAGVLEPMIVLEDGAIRLAARCELGGIQTVVSARLLVDGSKDGLALRLDSVSGGRLPIPVIAVRELLGQLDGSVWPAGRVLRQQYFNEPLPPLAGLPEGIVLPNSWVWQNGEFKAPMWIKSLQVRPGEIVATVEPLPRQSRR